MRLLTQNTEELILQELFKTKNTEELILKELFNLNQKFDDFKNSTQRQFKQIREEIQELEQNMATKEELKALEEKMATKEELRAMKENVNSTEYIEKIAREKLGMYLPNEKVYIDIGK